MAKRTAYVSSSEYREQISKLKNDLAMACHHTLDLMSEPARRILTGYGREISSRSEVWRWAELAAVEIVETRCTSVEQATYKGQSFGAPRSACPLCWGESSSYYERGFALPEGLVRHLLGSHNSMQCFVFKAAMELAFARAEDDMTFGWRSKASEAE